MMQVQRLICEQCNSSDVQLIQVLDDSQQSSAYAFCPKCQELVAYYRLNDHYLHGKGLDTYLQTHGIGEADSARQWLSEYKRIKESALSGYEAAMKCLAEQSTE